MLRLEWIARLFSVIMAVFLGITLSPTDATLLLRIFVYVAIAYSLLLLFKKQLYPWPVGNYYNLTIEASELMLLLYLHSASPFVVVLFMSFILRMACIYNRRIYLSLGIVTSALFILVDYYSISLMPAGYILTRIAYWLIGFGGYIWFLGELSDFVKGLEDIGQDLKDIIGLKDVLIDELNESRDRLLKENDELYVWANRDPLTNLYNSRYYNRYWDNIYEQFSQFKQNNYPITLIMLDIQGHRIYNSVYGHAAGDVLLQDLASILKDCSEAEDIVVRYSDYVFAVVIPGQQEGEAVGFYDRFKKRIDDYGKEHPGMRNIEISIGWSSCVDVADQTKEELMTRATNNMRLLK